MTPDPRALSRLSALRVAAVVGAAYFVMGSLWILLSDALVQSVSSDPDWLAAAQRWKGLVYIVLTTAGLIVLFRYGYLRLMAAQAEVAEMDLSARDLFMNHPDPMWAVERDTLRFLRVNDAAVSQFGFSRAEFLQMGARGLLDAADWPAFVAGVASQAAGHALAGVYRMRQKSGGTLEVRLTGHGVRVERRQAFLLTAANLTEEMRTQRALQRQQEQFRQLHQSLGELLWMASPDGRQLHYVSPAFASLYGRAPEELMADPDLWLKMVHPGDRQAAEDSLRAVEAHRDVSCEYRIIRPDGSIRWIEDRKRPITDVSGTVTMIGGIAEDITARHERDEARAQLESRLEKLVSERTCELEAANSELEAFSRTVAHDLKSPLNGIVGLAHLLRLRHAGNLDAKALGYIDQIERSGRDMSALIGALLVFSHAGKAELQLQDVDLAAMARELFDDLCRALVPRQLEYIGGPPFVVRCDASLMRAVLQNLIGNAVKYTEGREAARIEVAGRLEGGEWRVTVADNGCGFDCPRGEAPFKPFQRFVLDDSIPGTGLGLVTCQRVLQRHGGRLIVESTPGVGTVVHAILPAQPAPARLAARELAPALAS